jgi:hypothetical protein
MPEPIPTGHDGADEALVRHYLKQLRAGRPYSMPWLVRLSDGRQVPVDEHDAAKVEAARRHGLDTISAYVVADPGPEKLRRFRERRQARRLSSN